jgi:hypothetical protein
MKGVKLQEINYFEDEENVSVHSEPGHNNAYAIESKFNLIYPNNYSQE